MSEGEKLHLFDEFELDRARGCLLRSGRPVHLRPQAYRALKFLAENRGRLIGKDYLIEEIWEGQAVTDDSLVKCLRDVRQALGEGGSRYLRTERGRGYIFDPEAGSPEDPDGRRGWDEQVELVRVVVEDEVEAGKGVMAQAGPPPVLTHERPGPTRPRRAGRTLALTAGCLLAGGLAVWAAYTFFRPGTTTPERAVGVRSLAVLPFKPLVPEGRDKALEIGMADTLIAKLGTVREVLVRPLSAVRRYGGLEQDPLAAGAQLGVEAVLDGTIQRSGDSIRVTARLMRVADGRQLWEGRFDTRFTDIFMVQDSISEKVAGSLKLRLTSAEETRLAKRYTENVEAYQLYLRGRYYALKRTLPETQRAISYFQQAIAVDPSYALAYVGLADAHVSFLATSLPSDQFFPQARAAVQKAIEIDDTLAAAHSELGFIIFWYDWDWGASERQFKQALELDPNDANTHLFYAHLLSNTGRHEEALAEVKRARELEPVNLYISALEGSFLFHAGRTDEALARLHETLELDPNYFLALQSASSAYIEKGMYSEAIGIARKARDIAGARGTHAEANLAYALAKSGKEAEARSVLEGILKSSGEGYVPAYRIALVYNGLGEHDKALAWLERAYAQHDPGMVFLGVEAKWNNLRPDPRFQDLLQRVGLPR